MFRGRARLARRASLRAGLILVAVLTAAQPVAAEIPTILSDKIHKGPGVIDLMKDATTEELAAYLEGGAVYLGVDLNEDAGGNESASSLGVAIEQMELVITTTEGEFTFSEFFTNTTAMIVEEGSAQSQEFYTMFGSSGSNEISGSTSGFDLSQFDDVVELRNVAYSGDILSAELRVSFVNTSESGSNETFFDYSDGFEEFALLADQDAAILDDADVGVSEAAGELEYTYYNDIDAAVAAPEPELFLAAAVPLLLYLAARRGATRVV
jgi:hypothetical protein